MEMERMSYRCYLDALLIGKDSDLASIVKEKIKEIMSVTSSSVLSPELTAMIIVNEEENFIKSNKLKAALSSKDISLDEIKEILINYI